MRRLRQKRKSAQAQRLEQLGAIPREQWMVLAGIRWRSTVGAHAELSGLPIGGETIELAELVPALHAYIAGQRSRESEDGEAQRIKLARAAVALERDRFNLQRERGEYVELPEIRRGLAALAELMRRAIDQAQRRFGAEGRRLWEEIWQDFLAAAAREFGTDAGSVPGDVPDAEAISATVHHAGDDGTTSISTAL